MRIKWRASCAMSGSLPGTSRTRVAKTACRPHGYALRANSTGAGPVGTGSPSSSCSVHPRCHGGSPVRRLDPPITAGSTYITTSSAPSAITGHCNLGRDQVRSRCRHHHRPTSPIVATGTTNAFENPRPPVAMWPSIRTAAHAVKPRHARSQRSAVAG
jgi:hypothetical protein